MLVAKTCQLLVIGSNTAVVGSRTNGRAASVVVAKSYQYDSFGVTKADGSGGDGGGPGAAEQLNPMQPVVKLRKAVVCARTDAGAADFRKQQPDEHCARGSGVKLHPLQVPAAQHAASHAVALARSSVRRFPPSMFLIATPAVRRESHASNIAEIGNIDNEIFFFRESVEVYLVPHTFVIYLGSLSAIRGDATSETKMSLRQAMPRGGRRS
jgi:hypothetical protein